MSPLTLVQKRALQAAMNNAQKAERRYIQAVNAYHTTTSRASWNAVVSAAENWAEARRLVNANARRQAAARKIQSAYRRYRVAKRASPKRSPYTPRSMRKIPRTNLN